MESRKAVGLVVLVEVLQEKTLQLEPQAHNHKHQATLELMDLVIQAVVMTTIPASMVVAAAVVPVLLEHLQ
jgi:hypothetical protein